MTPEEEGIERGEWIWRNKVWVCARKLLDDTPHPTIHACWHSGTLPHPTRSQFPRCRGRGPPPLHTIARPPQPFRHTPGDRNSEHGCDMLSPELVSPKRVNVGAPHENVRGRGWERLLNTVINRFCLSPRQGMIVVDGVTEPKKLPKLLKR